MAPDAMKFGNATSTGARPTTRRRKPNTMSTMNTIALPAALIAQFALVLDKSGNIDYKATSKHNDTATIAYDAVRKTGAKSVSDALAAVFKDNSEKPMQRSVLTTLLASRMGVTAQNVGAINEAIEEHLPSLIVSDRTGSRPGTPEEVAKAQVALQARLAKSQATREANKAQPTA
jgi:hypothetical protein